MRRPGRASRLASALWVNSRASLISEGAIRSDLLSANSSVVVCRENCSTSSISSSESGGSAPSSTSAASTWGTKVFVTSVFQA